MARAKTKRKSNAQRQKEYRQRAKEKNCAQYLEKERMRWKKRRIDGKVKTALQISDRDHRRTKTLWKQASKKYRDKQKHVCCDNVISNMVIFKTNLEDVSIKYHQWVSVMRDYEKHGEQKKFKFTAKRSLTLL